MSTGSKEQEEAFALGLVANGNGTHPLEEHPQYDEAEVCFWLEDPSRVTVFLSREGKTKREFRFRLVPAGAVEPLPDDDEAAPRDVCRAVAKRFLCDTLTILKESPGSLQAELLEKALDNLVESGQLRDEEETKLLRNFVRAWPGWEKG